MGTYNGGLYLREQLDSIAAQTRPPDELVVCDDGSTDRTVAIWTTSPPPRRSPCGSMSTRGTSARPRTSSARSGSPRARSSRSPTRTTWYPHKLERLEKEFARSERIGLVFSDADIVDDRLRPAGYRLWEALRTVERNRRLIVRGRLFEALIRDDIVFGCTAAFRADYKDLVLPIDWPHDCWTAFLIAAVADIARTDESLLAYRQHAANQSGLARYMREKYGIGHRTRKPTAEHLRKIERRVARLRAAYHRLDWNRTAFRPSTVTSAFFAARSGTPRRTAILRESSLARRALTASWELATLRYVRYSRASGSAART